MAYHVARILQEDFGFVGIGVGDATPDHGLFNYSLRFRMVSLTDLETSISDDDVLIANPSFSHLWLGLKCRGRKLMYIQGFRTFRILDCCFDYYVSASEFVRKFVSSTYAIETEVVPPFISAESFPAAARWRDRPPGSVLTLTNFKSTDDLEQLLLHRLRGIVAGRFPALTIDAVPAGAFPHRELVGRIGRYRHFLTFSVAEGFGLIPLEAMAMGVTVVGFDAFGGRDYMRDGVNCAVTSYPDVEGVADRLAAVLANPDYAQSLAESGRITGNSHLYTYERFRSDWHRHIAAFLAMGH